MKGGRERGSGGREWKKKREREWGRGKRKEGKRRERDHGVHFKTDKDYKDLFHLLSKWVMYITVYISMNSLKCFLPKWNLSGSIFHLCLLKKINKLKKIKYSPKSYKGIKWKTPQELPGPHSCSPWETATMKATHRCQDAHQENSITPALDIIVNSTPGQL